jgi:hypothetical protein
LIAGKSEVSAIVYKAGECMQELLKSWKESEATQDAGSSENRQNGPTLEIRIPAEFVTSTNRQVSLLGWQTIPIEKIPCSAIQSTIPIYLTVMPRLSGIFTIVLHF